METNSKNGRETMDARRRQRNDGCHMRRSEIYFLTMAFQHLNPEVAIFCLLLADPVSLFRPFLVRMLIAAMSNIFLRPNIWWVDKYSNFAMCYLLSYLKWTSCRIIVSSAKELVVLPSYESEKIHATISTFLLSGCMHGKCKKCQAQDVSMTMTMPMADPSLLLSWTLFTHSSHP